MAILSNVGHAVEKELLNNPKTSPYKFDVVEKNGLVTISGTVDSQKAQKAVGHIVSALPGVIKVINEITISDESNAGDTVVVHPSNQSFHH